MNKIENWKKRKGFKQTKINSPMLVSLLSFVVCLVMLASCCYAWFTAVLQGPKSNIKAGTFGVEAVVSQSDGVGDGATLKEAEAIGNESISIEVPNGNTYQVSLTAIGEASKGYCVVTVNDTNGETVYHTGPILMTEEPLEFTLVSTGIGTTEITIQPSWGEYQEDSGVGSKLIEGTITVSGEVEEPVENIAETAPEETTTVAETTEEVTTEAVETTAEETSAEVETTEVAETTTEVETTTEAETTTEMETTEVAEPTTEAETTAEATTEAVETTAADPSAEAETTVNATVEATTEAVETAADTTEADTTEAVETVETSAEETTAEATTESLTAEE